ncbi:MAG: AbrB/MazE/SpoVT family DNA-binding domain-containing protein, partial [Gemmatimonadaceae bacterium]
MCTTGCGGSRCTTSRRGSGYGERGCADTCAVPRGTPDVSRRVVGSTVGSEDEWHLLWRNAIYIPTMTTTVTIDKAGRIIVPKALRDALHLEAGDTLELEAEGEQMTLRPV